ncbi:MAG: CaiB/BaiF CoA transferase family protein [Longimicrobiales bacterium]
MQVLEGVRVADFSESLAGPFCGQILADLGADVVKLERPGGDPGRAWGPPFWGGEAAMFLAANRGKRSVELDLRTSLGSEAAKRLIAGSDVVLQSFRAGVAARLGIDYDAARRLNSRVIYCSISAYGPRGPRNAQPGYDPLIQAYAGIMSVTGNDGGPARSGVSLVDMGSGLAAALAIVGALRRRDATGVGALISAPLLDTALVWMSYHLMGYLATGVVPGPRGAQLAMIAPYGAYPTADGAWIMIGAATDALFETLCGALGSESLARDPRFGTNPDRVANRDALDAELVSRTGSVGKHALLARLEAAGVPCAPIQRVDEVVRDPQVEASGALRRVERAGTPGYADVALPFEVDGERPAAVRPVPGLGEHTTEVLRELGLPADD